MEQGNETVKGKPFALKDHVNYAIGSVVSKTLLKKDTGNITLFSFDAGQGLSELILNIAERLDRVHEHQ